MTTMTKDVLTMLPHEFEAEARSRLDNAQQAARAAADAETIASAAVDEARIQLASGVGSRSQLTLRQRELAKRQEEAAQAEAAIRAVDREATAARAAREQADREAKWADEAAAQSEAEALRDEAAELIDSVAVLIEELADKIDAVRPRLRAYKPGTGVENLPELKTVRSLAAATRNVAGWLPSRPAK